MKTYVERKMEHRRVFTTKTLVELAVTAVTEYSVVMATGLLAVGCILVFLLAHGYTARSWYDAGINWINAWKLVAMGTYGYLVRLARALYGILAKHNLLNEEDAEDWPELLK